jgi:hypothetical protein
LLEDDLELETYRRSITRALTIALKENRRKRQNKFFSATLMATWRRSQINKNQIISLVSTVTVNVLKIPKIECNHGARDVSYDILQKRNALIIKHISKRHF